MPTEINCAEKIQAFPISFSWVSLPPFRAKSSSWDGGHIESSLCSDHWACWLGSGAPPPNMQGLCRKKHNAQPFLMTYDLIGRSL